MHDTVKHILQNFKYLIEKYGYIPNGGRTYMLQRTQPPFFIPMVYEYHTVTADDEFLLSVMGSMETVTFLWKFKFSINNSISLVYLAIVFEDIDILF